MADENKTAEDQEFLEDGVTPNPDYKEPEDGGEEGTEDENDDDKGGEEEEEEDDAGDDDAEVDVSVRKSVQSHIITRQKKTINKLRKKEGEDEDEDDNDDGELSPEASSAIEEGIGKAIKPLKEALTGKIDTDELDSLFTSTPNAKKYEKRIKAYMASDEWSKVPVTAIYRYLAFENAESIGAKKKKVADKEADQTRGAGSSIRSNKAGDGNVPSIEEMGDMSDAEFEKLQQEVQRGKFIQK